jgi:DNA-directed RNA polymerase subunit RPC12/RpoP
MTIRFRCTECGKTLSVKNESARKKGKCACGAVIVVPAETEGDIIRFSCGACGRHIKVGQDYAGQKVRCPQCKNMVVVPGVDDLHTVDIVSGLIVDHRQAAAGMMRFRCSACHEHIEVKESSVGNLIECPKCGGITEVPERGDTD